MAASSGNTPPAGMGSRLKALAGQSAVYGFGSVAARVVSLFLLPLYTGYLAPRDYGAVELVMALVTFVSLVAKLGLVNATFRFFFDHENVEKRREVFQTAFWTLQAVTLATALVMLALRDQIGAMPGFNKTTDPALLVALGAVGVWVSVNYDLITGLYRLQQRPLAFSLATVANVVITVLFSVWFIVGLRWGGAGVLLGNFLGSIVIYFCLVASEREWVGLRVDRPLLRQMLNFGVPLIPAGAALWAVNLIDRPIVSRLLSPAALGVYAVAYKLTQGVNLLVTAFQLAWPAFAYSIKRDDEAKRVYGYVALGHVVVMGWAVAITTLLAPWLFDLFVRQHAKYAGAIPVILPLALSVALYGLFYIVAIAVGRAKKTRFNWVITLSAALIEVVLCYAFIPRWGLVGAGWASAAGFAAMVLMMALYGRRWFPIEYPLRKIALTIVVGTVVLVIGQASPAHGLGGLVTRLALLAAYPLLLVAVGVVSITVLRRAARPLLRRA